MPRFSATRRRHAGTTALSGYAGTGFNAGSPAWYYYETPFVDIVHGLAPTVVGGASNGIEVPLANYDTTDWSIQSLPTGATGYAVYLFPTGTSAPHKLSWSNAYNGAISTFRCTSVGTQNAHDIALTPQTIGQASLAGAASVIVFNVGTGGTLPRDLQCRPVTDPGGTAAEPYKTKFQQHSGSSGIYRAMKLSTVEANLHDQNPGAGFNYPTLYYPTDASGELGEPILTAANRNTPRSINWWSQRDGVPIEVCVQMANDLNRPLKLNVHWNADSTYYSKVADIVLNGSTVNGVTYPALNSDLYVAVSNEPWNFGYEVAHQAANEADRRGTVSPGNKTSCLLVATTNITLSGGQTIDGVAVATGNRILVTGQTDTTKNGVWIANTGGAWTRATDADASGEIAWGDVWFITAGSSYANTSFICRTSTSPIVPGTTPLTISRFERWDRHAEKSCEVFKLFEAAFNTAGQRSRLHTSIEWQNAASPTVWATMLALPDRLGSTIASHVNFGSTAAYFGEDLSDLSYAGSASTQLATYYHTSGYNIDLVIGWAAGHRAALAAITGQGGVPIKFENYEIGRQDANNSATYLQTIDDDPGGHDVQAYFANECRRRLGTDFKSSYFTFVGAIQTGSLGTFGLLKKVDEDASLSPQAKAMSEAVAGTYTLFDPTFTQTAGHSDDGVDTVVGTFSYGVLPEASFSLVDATGYFKVASVLNASGELEVSVKTASPPAGTYSLQLVQTDTNAVNGPTKNTNFSLTVASAIPKSNFNNGTTFDSGWGTSIDLTRGQSGTGLTVSQTGGVGRIGNPGITNRGATIAYNTSFNVTTAGLNEHYLITTGDSGVSQFLAFGANGGNVLFAGWRDSFVVVDYLDATGYHSSIIGGGAVASYPGVKFKRNGANVELYKLPSGLDPTVSANWVLVGSAAWPSTVANTGYLGAIQRNEFGASNPTNFDITSINMAA